MLLYLFNDILLLFYFFILFFIQMKRRNTIDCATSDIWPICQYYYTHNNGSYDDVLTQHRGIVNRVQRQQSQRRLVQKKSLQDSMYYKRYTYPMRHNNKDKKSDFLIVRGWSTTHRRKQKRQTLANIITALSSGADSKTSAAVGSISKSSSNDNNSKKIITNATSRSILESKWANIRQYNPQLDNEKIEQVFNEQFGRGSLDEEYSHSPIIESQTPVLEQQQTRSDGTATITTATNTLLNSSNISIETTNQLLLNSSAGKSTATGNHCDDNDDMFIAIPIQEQDVINHSSSSSSSNSLSPPNSPFLPSMERQKQQQKEAYNSSLDMFLFLFGFLFFPLWWFGAWRYSMQQDESLISKQRLSFQVLNCYMTLASLLMTGLMIGLVTVWA